MGKFPVTEKKEKELLAEMENSVSKNLNWKKNLSDAQDMEARG